MSVATKRLFGRSASRPEDTSLVVSSSGLSPKRSHDTGTWIGDAGESTRGERWCRGEINPPICAMCPSESVSYEPGPYVSLQGLSSLGGSSITKSRYHRFRGGNSKLDLPGPRRNRLVRHRAAHGNFLTGRGKSKVKGSSVMCRSAASMGGPPATYRQRRCGTAPSFG